MWRDASATTAEGAAAALQERVDVLAADRPGLAVLDAGCGRESRVRFPSDARIVGVDENEAALALNEDLDEVVVADLATWEPPHDAFDAITCWYVFEHVDRPDILLDRFAKALKPGGFVVLSMPNLRSPKALVTKFTPHTFHVWWRRRVQGWPYAGQPGYGPYPTTLRLSIAPGRIVRHAAEIGLEVDHVGWFEEAGQRKAREKLRLTGIAWKAVRRGVAVGSLGLLDAERTEMFLIFRKRPVNAAGRMDARVRNDLAC